MAKQMSQSSEAILREQKQIRREQFFSNKGMIIGLVGGLVDLYVLVGVVTWVSVTGSDALISTSEVSTGSLERSSTSQPVYSKSSVGWVV